MIKRKGPWNHQNTPLPPKHIYGQLPTYGSISVAINEHKITAMYNKWSNKNKTRQLKMSNRLFKANSIITTL